MIKLKDLIAQLKLQSPMGIELPRDPDTNQIFENSVARWASDAAGLINQARQVTTIKEVTIDLLAGVQDYSLPLDSRAVIRIQRSFNAPDQSNTYLDVPLAQPILGYGRCGVLPSGQEISPSLDLLNRQRLVRQRREDEFELFNGQIRMLFTCRDGDKVRVTYRAVDRNIANIPDDYFTQMLMYLRWQNLEFYMEKTGVAIVQDSDRLVGDRMASYKSTALTLEDRWLTFLNSLAPEA